MLENGTVGDRNNHSADAPLTPATDPAPSLQSAFSDSPVLSSSEAIAPGEMTTTSEVLEVEDAADIFAAVAHGGSPALCAQSQPEGGHSPHRWPAVSDGWPYDISCMYVGTVHSLCQQIISDRPLPFDLHFAVGRLCQPLVHRNVSCFVCWLDIATWNLRGAIAGGSVWGEAIAYLL